MSRLYNHRVHKQITLSVNEVTLQCVVYQWFLNTMAEDDWWPQQILIKCPNQMVRQVS